VAKAAGVGERVAVVTTGVANNQHNSSRSLNHLLLTRPVL